MALSGTDCSGLSVPLRYSTVLSGKDKALHTTIGPHVGRAQGGIPLVPNEGELALHQMSPGT